jgi:hypothetical protein
MKWLELRVVLIWLPQLVRIECDIDALHIRLERMMEAISEDIEVLWHNQRVDFFANSNVHQDETDNRTPQTTCPRCSTVSMDIDSTTLPY